ncbi:MAG TPA: magnesium-translocating P-type ATPase [Bryobacteraceae bacterium]|nr:magnesium-translocating P-type ATPase [Bryobacteraceae bacterium]
MVAADVPSSVRGLSSTEAAERLGRFGPNEPTAMRTYSGAREFLAALASPLVLILLCAAAISVFAGERVDASLIIAIVLIGVTINFAQSHRSRKAAEKLREQVSPTATVLRDGAWCEIPRRQVVPGDIIHLSAGDLVPADARLIDARDLHVQEAALTGESLPAEKAPGSGTEGKVFLGTSVVSGIAIVEVTATGAATEFGEIASRLAAKPPETEFQRGLRRFSYLILRTTLFLVLFIVAVRIALRQDAFQSILFAVALAVGLTPEFLPMITSLTLAKGAIRMAREKVIVRHLASIQDFGSMDILCSDKTGTLTSGNIALESSLAPNGSPSDRPLELAYWNSKLETGVRSPLDAAILRQPAPRSENARKVDEAPFDFQRRRLSVVVEFDGERMLITKGAPESVLSVCTEFEAGSHAESYRAIYEDLGRQGKRVLGVAFKRIAVQPAYTASDEHSLTFVGFLVFTDPVLPDTAGAIADLKRDGVIVKVLTGDTGLVAQSLCGQVGLDDTDMITGEEIEQMTDGALSFAVENHTVFARVTPAQKTRILLALKRRGHVVGFMGDGINDAPSLRAADVGISVATAVDVAREAAGIVLTEPGFRILHTGILEGRRAYGNILKYLLMGTSSNFGNMFSMAVASVALPFLPMLPTQILLNNFLYDLAQITIPTDHVDPEILSAPHRWDIGIVRNFMIGVGPVSSLFDLLTFFVLLRIFRADEVLFHTGWFVESLATQTLVLLVIRTVGNPFRSPPSSALLASTLIIIGLAVALPYTPLAGRFGFVPLPMSYMAFVAGAVAAYLFLVELVKRPFIRSEIISTYAPSRRQS